MDPNDPSDCESSRIAKQMSAATADESKSHVRQLGLVEAKEEAPETREPPNAAGRRWMENARFRNTAKYLCHATAICR